MGVDKFYRRTVGPKGDFRKTINCLIGTLTATATPYSAANPLGADVLVIKVMLKFDGGVTSTPVSLDIGCAAADAVTSNDNLIDGIAIGTPTSATVFDSITDKGTNGLPSRKWDSDKYLNVVCTGTPTGLAGKIYIHYVKV